MEVDEDGDLVVQRRRHGSAGPDEQVLSEIHIELPPPTQPNASRPSVFKVKGGAELVLQHHHSTPISLVGLQVWRGSLLLADYLLGPGRRRFEGVVGLELGAGVGAAGLVLARAARRVFLTDVGQAVMANLGRNAAGTAPAAVRELDWLQPPGWLRAGGREGSTAAAVAASPPPFGWQPEDVEELRGLAVILAADVVYDNDLTQGAMDTAATLLRWAEYSRGEAGGAAEPPVLLVALERRVCFTLRGMRECAPAYDYWRTTVREEEREEDGIVWDRGGGASHEDSAAGPSSSGAGGGVRDGAAEPARPPGPALVGRRIDLGGVPQVVEGYERGGYLELWELRLAAPAPS